MLNNHMPLISVIMPTFNSSKYIKYAINSVLNQTYTNFELVIVDDGSTDATGMIIDEFAEKDSRIHVYHTANHGASHARNIGLDNAKGEWVSFLDSDDMYTEDALEKLFGASEGVECVKGSHKEFGDVSIDHKEDECTLLNKNDIREYAIKKRNLTLFMSFTSRLYKKSSLTVRFNEDFLTSEDTDFLIRYTGNISTIRMISDVVFCYRRQFKGSKSTQGIKCRPEISNSIATALCNFFENDSNMMDSIYNLYVFLTIKYVKGVLEDMSLSEDEKIKMITETQSTDFMKTTKDKEFNLESRFLSRWLAIRIGEIDIMNAAFFPHSRLDLVSKLNSVSG